MGSLIREAEKREIRRMRPTKYLLIRIRSAIYLSKSADVYFVIAKSFEPQVLISIP